MTPLPYIMAHHAGLAARNSVEYQQEHLYEDYTRNLGGFIIVLVFLSFISMTLRIWCRIHMHETLGQDDYTYVAGTILAIGSFIVMLLYAFDAGLGKHWIALTPEQKLLFPKLNYAYNILNVLCYPLLKISILLLYIRIFYPLTKFVRIVRAAIVVIAAACIANTLVAMFACTPMRGFFDTSVPARCVDSVAFYYWTGAFNCATDFFILIAPMPVIWKRDINHKGAITTIFVLGGLTFVISILRIVYYLEYSIDDPSYSFLDSGYATPGEVCLATIVAAAPTWRPLWRMAGRGLKSLYGTLVSRSRGSEERLRSDAATANEERTAVGDERGEKRSSKAHAAVHVPEPSDSSLRDGTESR